VLALQPGAEMTIRARGREASEAIRALVQLAERKFLDEE
jgi:phosphotransferase system HPr-like phosphotransfer protein